MVEELKLAIKIDDATVEQSLLKQFANAQKMADKVVLDFKNVNFDDKQIEAKFKEMQKKAGQNPIDLSISGNTLDMLGQIDKRLTEIFSIGKGKSFIDSSSTVADIGKIENKINELNKKYEEAQKKLSSIGSGNISGKDVNLVDNKEFQKLSQEVSELKNQFDDLKTHMQLLDDYTVPTDRFFELQSQVETTTVKVSDLVEEFTKLSNAQKALSSTPQESNISSDSTSLINDQNNYQKELSETKKLTDDNVSSMFEFIKLCQEQAKALGETNEELKERAAYFKDEKISGGVSIGTHYVGNHDNSDINGANSDLHSHFSKYASFSENDLFNLKDTIKNFMVMGTDELTHFDTSGLSNDLLEQIWLRYDAAIKELNQQYFDNLNIKNNLKFTDIEDIPERILDKAFEFAENQSNIDYDYDKYDVFYNNQIEKIRQKLLEGASLNDITNSISDDIKSFDINGVESEIKIFQEKFTEGIRGYLTNILLENDIFNPDKMLGMQDYNIARNNSLKSVLEELNVDPDRLKTIDISNLEEGYSSLLKILGLVVDKQKEVVSATTTDQTKDAFPNADSTASVEKVADGFKEVKQETEKATESAKEYGKILSQVGLVSKKYNDKGEQIPSQYSYTRQTGENQVQTITVKFEKDKESGEIVEREIIGEYITGFQALEKEIDKADKKIFDLKKSLESNKIKLGENYDTSALDKLIEDTENDANMLYEALRKVYSEQSEYEYSIAQYDDERAKKQTSYNTQLENTKKIEEARAKNASDKKDESAEKKRQDNITQTNRLLNKQQILIDEIEKTYKRTPDNPIDKAVDDTKDLDKLAEKKAAIKGKIDSVYKKGRNSTNEKTFLEIEQLISEYKQLAAAKLKANNPSKQELGGQKLYVLLSQQVAQYNQLIAKAEKYGNATADIVQKLKDQRDVIAEINSDGIYTAKSGLKAEDYYSARDNYKKSKAEFTSYEQVAKVNNVISETKSLLNSLKVPNEFKGSFSTLESEAKRLNNEFSSGKISVTKYADSVKKAFSDYKTPIDNKVKETWDDITNSLNRYATLQKRIASNNALSTDAEEAEKLKSHIDDLKEDDILSKDKLNIVDEKLQQINQTVTDLKAKLKESTLDSLQGSIDKYQKIYNQRSTYSSDFTPSEQYTKNLTGLNTAIGNLVEYRNTLKNVSEVTVEQETHLKGLVAACEKASDSFKSLSASEKGASQIAVDKLVQRINKDLDECTNYSKEAKLGLRALRDELESANPRNLKEITSEIINIENAEIKAGRAGRSFFDTLKNSGFHQLAAQMAGMFGFYDVINLGKEGFNVARELNTALTEMRKVSDESIQTLKDYQKESFNTADAIATTGLQMQNSIADWQRLGYSIKEANELAKNSNIYKNVGDMDISTATEHMVSSVQAWKSEFNDDAVKTSEEVMNRYNKIGNEFAISSADIGEAMETSSAALKAGGNDLNEALGIITAGNIIQQDASTTSSAMKILSLRIRGAKADLESMGESTDDLADSTSKLREEIKGLTGVDIMADEDTFKSTAEIIKEIGAVWNQLSDVSQAATLEKLAGKNRASTVAGLIENYETIDKVIEAASNADNSALDENQKIIESIDGRIQQLSNRVQEFWYNLVDDSVVKSAVSALTTIVEGGTKLIDTFDTLPTLLAAIGAGLSFKNIGKCYVSA